MASQLLSIDLQSDLLTAVLLEDDINQDIIASTAIITEDKTPAEIITELVSTLDCSDCRCFLALGASFFTFKNLTLPFSDRKSIHKVLPFELEENSAIFSDTMLVDFLVNKEEGSDSEIITAMVEKELIGEFHTALKQEGLTPELITLSGLASIYAIQNNGEAPEEFIFLDLRLNNASLFLVSGGKIQIIRPLSFSPQPFEGGMKAGFITDAEDGFLQIQGIEHSAEALHELALSVKQTLAPLTLTQNLEQIPIYIDGTAGSTKRATSWLEAPDAFNRSCLICGRPGLLPLPIQLPEASKLHASYLVGSLSLGKNGAALKKSLNFCQQEFRFRNDLAEYRSMGKMLTIGLIVILVLSMGYLLFDSRSLKKERRALVSEIQTVFKQTLPQVRRIVDPVQQLNIAIKEAGSASQDGSAKTLSYTALQILRELSIHIPSSIDVRLTRMVYESKGIRLTGLTDSFNSVDSIKKNLEKSALISEVVISSTKQTPKNNKIRFDLKIAPETKTP